MKFLSAKKERAGFTLIELLVVITIIGMLASIVLAGTNQARYKAKTAVVKKQFQQLQLAMQMYYDKNNNSWGNPTTWTNPAPGLGNNSATSNPSAPGNYCPTASTYMFGDPDIMLALDAIYKVFPNGTLECLESNLSTEWWWTVYFTFPPSSGSLWNKWCMDNYISGNRALLVTSWNGSANRQIRQSNVVTCGDLGDTPPNVTPYSSPDL